MDGAASHGTTSQTVPAARPRPRGRHARPQLFRDLSLASGLLLVAALALITWMYDRQATRDLVDLTAQHNIAMDRLLSNTVWAHYGPHLASAAEMDGATLRARPETARIAAAIREITAGIPILKVKFYSPAGRILFSTETQEIGGDYGDSEAVRLAARYGRISSELSRGDAFTAFSGEIFQRDVVETYMPATDTGGSVVGVTEIYTDVSDATAHIRHTTIRLALGLTAILGLTYAVLVVVIMRRAIEPIRRASQRAAGIGPDASGVRLATEGVPGEILPLIVAINGALERLDRALDAQRRFTADAAHELLTPLAVLRAEIDAEGPGSAFAPLRREVDSMNDMVTQLLILSEIESRGAGAFATERADLHAVAADVVAMLAPLAVREGKELALAGAGGPQWVRGSPRMLARALRNLLDNGIAHTPPGTAVELHLGAGGEVRVSDHGKGIPPAERELVFRRFWRGGRATRPGAGLGLSIVRKIVEESGGEIGIEDAPGGGACFVLRLVPEDAPTGK